MNAIKSLALRALLLGLIGLPSTTLAEEVIFDPDFGFPPQPIYPGDTIYIFVRLFDNYEPLVGYSLDIDVVPVNTLGARTSGQITGNPAESSFFEEANIITQGGGALHPYSDIFDPGDGGLFVNAFNLDFTPVALAGEGHDVFVRMAWDVSLDAIGEFTIQIGEDSLLADADANAIPFTWYPLTFEVQLPEPSLLMPLCLALIGLRRARS